MTITPPATSSASSHHAAPQGGILNDANPSKYDPNNPIMIFIMQTSIIITICRLLQYPLSKLRQPRVIGELVGGILLGPSVMGHIPGFTAAIFPLASLPNLTLLANLGLILFLFLIGLEVDLKSDVRNWGPATSIVLASVGLPFGLGCAIALGLYNQFHDEPGTVPISFGVYMFFIGITMAITAFPVLCRILAEFKLLLTPVGNIVLSAGVGNHVVCWVLLALCVALVNSGTGLTVLWILLTCVGYALFLFFVIRPIFTWILRKTRSLQHGPTQPIMALILMIVLFSAFFTEVIGVHPFLGAFMAGLICPREGEFFSKVTEKLEDLVSALLLPLYFALLGLNTNLGLLNTGITWAYVIAIIAVAFSSKLIGASLAARTSGLVWRECFTIGSLMSCKGQVELIVLNIGLQAQILSTRTFTIFVVMTLVCTSATTPLTAKLYPPWYQKKLEAWRRGEIDWVSGAPLSRQDDGNNQESLISELEAWRHGDMESSKVQRLLVYLRLGDMPKLLTFLSLFENGRWMTTPKVHPSCLLELKVDGTSAKQQKRPIKAHGVRLLELTERESSVMKVSELHEYIINDPVVNTFRTFGQLHNFAVSGEVAVVPEWSFADTLVTRASSMASDLILLPWSETGSMSDSHLISSDSVKHKLAPPPYTEFVERVLADASCAVAVIVSKNFGTSVKKQTPRLHRTIRGFSIQSNRENIQELMPVADRSHHIFLPFFGGTDDKIALRLVLQLAERPDVTATVLRIITPVTFLSDVNPKLSSTTPSAGNNKHIPTEAVTVPSGEQDAVFFSSLRDSLPDEVASRVVFDVSSTNKPVATVLERAKAEVDRNSRNAGDLIVLGRNKASRDAFSGEVDQASGADLDASRSWGVVAEATFRENLQASVLVVQARQR